MTCFQRASKNLSAIERSICVVYIYMNLKLIQQTFENIFSDPSIIEEESMNEEPIDENTISVENTSKSPQMSIF